MVAPRSSPWALAPPPGCQLLRFMGNFTRSSPKTCWARAARAGHPRCCSHSKLSSWEVSLPGAPLRRRARARGSRSGRRSCPSMLQQSRYPRPPMWRRRYRPGLPSGPESSGAQATRDDRAPAETARRHCPFKTRDAKERPARTRSENRPCVPLLSLLDSAKAAPGSCKDKYTERFCGQQDTMKVTALVIQ